MAFHEKKPLKSQSKQKSSALVVCWNDLEACFTNSVDQDQTAPEQSDLGPNCLTLYLH